VDKKWKTLLVKYSSLDKVCIIVLGCKGDLNHAIDTSLIKMTKPYIDDEILTSAKNSDQIEESLTMMITTIMNSTPAPSPSSSSSSTSSSTDNNGNRNVGSNPHQFKLKYFKTPTWCMFCDLFVWGVTSPQGYECSKCKYQSHKKCIKFIPHMCGLTE